ncbi:MAG: DUF4381 domain-containing protein [Gammaproteobacteria bacterium]
MDPRTIPLHDIHLPPPVDWWPPAPGWWALGVLLATGVALAVRTWRRRRRTRPAPSHADMVAEVWRTWQGLRKSLADPQAMADGVRDLSTLIRRVALTLHSRGAVAGLTGQRWLQFLDAPLGGTEFSRGPGRLLIQGPYQPGAAEMEPGEVERCAQLCERWLKIVLDGGRAGR